MAAEGEASAGPRAGALLLSKNSVTGSLLRPGIFIL